MDGLDDWSRVEKWKGVFLTKNSLEMQLIYVLVPQYLMKFIHPSIHPSIHHQATYISLPPYEYLLSFIALQLRYCKSTPVCKSWGRYTRDFGGIWLVDRDTKTGTNIAILCGHDMNRSLSAEWHEFCITNACHQHGYGV